MLKTDSGGEHDRQDHGDLLRKGEPVYCDLKPAKRSLSDDEIVELIVEHPDLIQRPIVIRGNKAVLGRPPENVEELL